MTRTTKFALAAGAAALTLGLAGAVYAVSEDGPGPGGCGFGHGYGMRGYHMGPGYGMGPGRGMGPGYGMGMGPGYGMGPGHGMGPGYGMGSGYHAGNGMPSCPGTALHGVLFGDPATVSARLEALKTTLAITDSQQAAWNAFAESAKKQAENRQALFEKMHSGPAARNTPEWLAQHSEAMKQRDADMTSLSASFRKLYDVLTPAQRTAIDEGQVALGPRYGWRGR